MYEVYEIDISPGNYYIHIDDVEGKSPPTEHWNAGRGDDAQIEEMSRVPLRFEVGFTVNKDNPSIFMPTLHNGLAGDAIKYKLVGHFNQHFTDILDRLKAHLKKYGPESNLPVYTVDPINDINTIIDFDADPNNKFEPFRPEVLGPSELEIERCKQILERESEERRKKLDEIYNPNSKTNRLSKGLESVKTILNTMEDSPGKSKLLQWLENNNKRVNRTTFERLTDNGVLTIICDILNDKNL